MSVTESFKKKKNTVLVTPNTGKKATKKTTTKKQLGRGFGKMHVNGPDGVEISKDKIPDSMRSMHGYLKTYS